MTEPVDSPVAIAQRLRIREILYELRRIARMKTELKISRKDLQDEAFPYLRKAGGMMFADPMTGEPLVAVVRQAETVTVDYDDAVAVLGQKLADEVSKPREIDTKQDGLFRKAVADGRITEDQVVKLAKLTAAAPFIAFEEPKESPDEA